MKKTVNVFSPAKVNLHLAIGPRRSDGYHAARSVMQALTLHDTVTVTLDDGVDDVLRPEGFADFAVEVTCEVREGVAALDIAPESNIAYKAAGALAEKLGRAQGAHVRIHIEKHIPHQAGLGGGSSNAAAALAGLCALWDVPVGSADVLEVAASLGADVPFFLHGGCAVLGGRGDEFERSLAPRTGTVVLVRPNAGVSTAAAYAAFDKAVERGEGGLGDALCESPESLEGVQSANELSLFNNLEAASEQVLPELARVRTWLAAQPGIARDSKTGEPCVLLSGSGSAMFALVDGGGEALEGDALSAASAIVAAAKQKGWWARSCSFTHVGARVIEGASIGGASGAHATSLGATHKIW